MMARHKAYQKALEERRIAMQQWVDDRPRRQAEAEAQREADLATKCASDRDGRMAEMKAYIDRRDKVWELQEWEVKHCKMVDRSKPIVRRVQDGFGEYHWIEGRDRGVDRECDAPLPEGLKTTWGRSLTPGNRPKGATLECKQLDIDASEIADEYWD